MLTEADYDLWGSLYLRSMSPKGGFVSYNISYKDGLDTLFVRNAIATKTFAFPKGTDGRFADDGWFGCLNRNKQLTLTNLQNGKQRYVQNVTKYDFSADGKLVVILNASGVLCIGRPDGSKADVMQSVTDFYFNQAKTAMLYTIVKEKASLHYCPLDGKREHFRMLANELGCTFESILWDKSDTHFSFVKKYPDANDNRNGRNLNVYSLDTNQCYSFDANTHKELSKESTVTYLSKNRFLISGDGERVFFYMTDIPDPSLDNPTVQVWNGNDVWTYRQVEVEGRFDKAAKCFVWFTKTGKLMQLTDNQQPKLFLAGNSDFAVTYHPAGNKPQFTQLNKTDWYITDIATGTKSRFLEDQLCDMDEIVPSPGGNYITYLKAKHWWVYEIKTGKHINITQSLPWPVVDAAHDYAGVKPAFGIAGWTDRDREILVYDEYDLWSINIKTLRCRKLTNGRDSQIRFRIAYSLGMESFLPNFDGHVSQLLDLGATHYLRSSSIITKKTGYYIWNGQEKQLIYSDKNVSQLGFTKESRILFCKVQDFDESPSVVSVTGQGQLKSVATTNDHQKNYHWGKSKLISYRNSKNQNLQAALYYPANYDQAKKYPMVVFIYDKLSKNVHDYQNPSLFNVEGINVTNLTAQGYFVLQPDIAFEFDNVGASAADCVIAATNTIIEAGLVDKNRIALHGHSFGGFEVSFIATQTSLFSTIIAGCGITDLVMYYNSLGWNSGKAEAWRFEDQQWRMHKPMYENMEPYLRNSPILHADKITAPMLLWTGELDRNVHYFQSIQLYNALRRLGKKEIMLIYPETRHNLTIPKYQIDFTRKYEEWLAYFLKGEPAGDWMKRSID